VAIRPLKDAPILDAQLEEEPRTTQSEDVPDRRQQASARRGAVARASLSLAPTGERPLYGTARFFEAAAEQLLLSTSHGLELAGAAYARRDSERTLLVGLKRCGSGAPGRVAVDPSWGEILWHTHPGLKGSLAAFSGEDLEAARLSHKPLLVIGFSGLSPDVVTTFTLPLGYRGFLLSSAVKGLLSLEKSGRLQRRLLRFGIAARVCYPSGRIQPVMRASGTPLQYALDDVSFLLDRTIGAVERRGQAALKAALKKVVGR
jgi:hypothetical protein